MNLTVIGRWFAPSSMPAPIDRLGERQIDIGKGVAVTLTVTLVIRKRKS